MSKEWMQKTITKLGFTEIDAKVYVFLSTEGSRKARDIAEALNLHRLRLYRVLKKLRSNGLIKASPEYPAFFSAVLFDKVLDIMIDAKKEQHKALQENEEILLSTWRSMVKEGSVDS